MNRGEAIKAIGSLMAGKALPPGIWGASIHDTQHRLFWVTDYGARGDGVADDHASVQATLDAARDAGGGIVLFPPGTFRNASLGRDNDDGANQGFAWRVYGRTHVLGFGAGVTILRSAVPDANVLYAHGTREQPCGDLAISGLSVVGSGERRTFGIDAIKLLGVRRAFISGVNVEDLRMACQLLGCEDIVVEACTARQMINGADTTAYAAGFNAGTNESFPASARITITGCTVLGSETHGFAVYGNTNAVSLTGCVGERCNGSAFYLRTACAATACHASAGSVGFTLGAPGGVRLMGCRAEANAFDGIRLTGARDCALSACLLFDNGSDRAGTYSGILAEDDPEGVAAAANIVTGCLSGNRNGRMQGYGYRATGASGGNLILGCRLDGTQGAAVLASADVAVGNL